MVKVKFTGRWAHPDRVWIGVAHDHRAESIAFLLPQQGKLFLKLSGKEYVDKIPLAWEGDVAIWQPERQSLLHAGKLDAQLQIETQEETVWQSHRFIVQVADSLQIDQEVEEQFPSVLAQHEERISQLEGQATLYGKSPYIDAETGTWFVYDDTTQQWNDTGILASVAGENGKSPYIDAETGTWFVYDDTTKQWNDTGILASVAGENGKSPYIGAETGTWFVYDDTTQQWNDTGILASVAGENGKSPYIGAKTGTWFVYDDTTQQWNDTGILASVAGENGKSPYIGAKTGTWFVYDDATKQWHDSGISTTGVEGKPGEKGEPGPKGEPGADGKTTSVNGVEQVNGNIKLSASDIPTQSNDVISVQQAIENLYKTLQTVQNNVASHCFSTIESQEGMHGIRYFNGTLQAYDGSKWVEV